MLVLVCFAKRGFHKGAHPPVSRVKRSWAPRLSWRLLLLLDRGFVSSQPLPSAGRQNQGSDGASMPGSFPPPRRGIPARATSRPLPERAPGPRPGLSGRGVLSAPTPRGRGRRQEGAGAGSVVGGLLSSPLCFHGNFISSKLLIELHIYDQKIKSLDLFEVGFYES